VISAQQIWREGWSIRTWLLATAAILTTCGCVAAFLVLATRRRRSAVGVMRQLRRPDVGIRGCALVFSVSLVLQARAYGFDDKAAGRVLTFAGQ